MAAFLSSTQGMQVACIPAVLMGEALAQKRPMKAIRIAAAGAFIAAALATMREIPGTAQ